MATAKQCCKCSTAGTMHCIGCDEYFCWEDFRIHRDDMFTELDKITEERNRLRDAIHNAVQNNDQQSPALIEIEKWKNDTIRKVEQVAAQARQQVVQLLNTKQMNINTELNSFSKELGEMKETKNFVEPDLIRLSQTLDRLKEEITQLAQPAKIELRTEGSNEINWTRLIYVEERKIPAEEPPKPSLPPPIGELVCNGRVCTSCGHCSDWHRDQDRQWQRRDGATCTYKSREVVRNHARDRRLCNCK